MDTDTEQHDDASAGQQPAGDPAGAAPAAAAPSGPSPAQAQEKLTALQADRAWMGAYLAGDKAKAEEMTKLYQVAYPASDQAPAQAADPSTRTEPEWLAPPRDPHEYDFSSLQTEEPTAEDRGLQVELKQVLHAEGVPAFAVAAAVSVLRGAVAKGMPDDAALEQSMRAGAAELERRHGVAKGVEMVKAARQLVARLEKRDPRIGDILHASGAGNSPYLIETLARVWTEKYAKAAA